MKKILKISSLAFLLIAGVSCENDNQTIATAMAIRQTDSAEEISDWLDVMGLCKMMR